MPWVGDHATDRGQLHDVPPAPGTHVRQHRPDRPQRAEHVRGQHRVNVGFGELLQRSDQAMTGVVDQYVDRPETGDRLGDGVVDLRAIGDIQT